MKKNDLLLQQRICNAEREVIEDVMALSDVRSLNSERSQLQGNNGVKDDCRC